MIPSFFDVFGNTSNKHKKSDNSSNYRIILENLPVGIFSIDFVKKGIVSANNRLINMFGCESIRDLKSFSPNFIKDVCVNKKRCEKFFEKLRKHRCLNNFEMKVRKKDGTAFSILVNASFMEKKILTLQLFCVRHGIFPVI
ncbi:MAG: PAS domain-containing protein [bacterium]